MRIKRLKPILFLLIFLVLLGLPSNISQAAQIVRQSNGIEREARFTVLIDYANKTVEIQGILLPGNQSAEAASAQLADWGLEGEFEIWKTEAQKESEHQPWYFEGVLANADIEMAGEDGVYHLRIDSLSLQPKDKLFIALPFANINTDEIRLLLENQGETSEVKNLCKIEGDPKEDIPVFKRNIIISSCIIDNDLLLEIPYSIARKDISLKLIPLMGERILGNEKSFRISGVITFEGLNDKIEFSRHCDNNVNSNYYSYRVGHTLFGLDYPPKTNLTFLNAPYGNKPTRLSLSSQIIECDYQLGVGKVTATFAGRVLYDDVSDADLPRYLIENDTIEQHIEIADEGIYEIQMGEIWLNPGDTLKVSVPGTEIFGVEPMPTSYQYKQAGPTSLEYLGPQRFKLSVQYVPSPEIIIYQFPTTLRAYSSKIEKGLRPLKDGDFSPGSIRLFIFGALLAIISMSGKSPARFMMQYLGVFLVAVALFYGFRNIIGVLLLGIILYFKPMLKVWNLKSSMYGIMLLSLLYLVWFLDTKAELFFSCTVWLFTM